MHVSRARAVWSRLDRGVTEKQMSAMLAEQMEEEPPLQAFLAKPTYDRARKLERLPVASGRPLRVTIGGNCNVDFLRPGLTVALRAEGFAPTLATADYSAWMQSAIAGTEKTDWWVVWLSVMGCSRGGLERRELDHDGLRQALAAIRARGESILLILPEASIWESDPFSPFGVWRTNLVRDLREIGGAEIPLLSVDHLQREIGMLAWHAPRYWTMAKSPCHPDAATRVGVAAASALALALRPKIKAIVADLDNTLWGGVVGDDGVDDLVLDPEGEGRPFVEMQRFLKDLSQVGIPLCVVSKNEPENARAPFRDREEMLIGLTDIVDFRASWNQKHLAIREIANSLNLGLDAICFLDDSPHERHEARTYLPELIVPELPEDPEARVPFLIASRLFATPVLRDEDLRRVEMYRAEGSRRVARHEAPDLATYLRALGMRLRAEPVSPATIGRAASLVQKTNQFNLTNARSSSQRLSSLARENYAFCSAMKDRFGDAGIIGVMAASVSGDCLQIEDWVLSCRVFGRGVEDAMFDHLLSWARLRNIHKIQVDYVPSAKNGIVSGALERLGFKRETTDASRYTVSADVRPTHAIAIDG